MPQETINRHVIAAEAPCELHGHPCRHAQGLVRSMLGALDRMQETLTEDFSLDAEVTIGECPSSCRLAVRVDGPCVSVFRNSRLLASGELKPFAVDAAHVLAGGDAVSPGRRPSH